MQCQAMWRRCASAFSPRWFAAGAIFSVFSLFTLLTGDEAWLGNLGFLGFLGFLSFPRTRPAVEPGA